MLVTLVVFKGREAEITQFFFMRLSRMCIDNTFCKKIGRDRFIPAWAARMANYLVWPTSWPGTVCKVWTLKPRHVNIVTLPFCPRHAISYTSTNTRSIWYPASWNPFWQLNYGLTTPLAGPWRPWCDQNHHQEAHTKLDEPILDGKSVLCCTVTGNGKSAAFSVPILVLLVGSWSITNTWRCMKFKHQSWFNEMLHESLL